VAFSPLISPPNGAALIGPAGLAQNCCGIRPDLRGADTLHQRCPRGFAAPDLGAFIACLASRSAAILAF